MRAFFYVVTALWLLAHVYLGRRLVDASRLADKRSVRALGWLLLTSLAALPLITMAVRRSSRTGEDTLAVMGFTSMGFSTLLIMAVLGIDLVLLARWVWRRFRPAASAKARPKAQTEAQTVAQTDAQTPGDAEVDPGRRRFFGDLGRAGVVGGAGGLTTLGYVHATRVPPVREVEVPIADLPAALEGYKIAQLTDIHIGPTIHGEWLREVVARVNGLEPDLVAVTGDVVDGLVPQLASEVAPLAELRGRDGVYYVTGNHEYYWDGLAWCRHFASLGMKVLVNAHEIIEREGARLLVGGVSDYRAGARVPGHKSDPAAALAGAPEVDLRVLLAHQPRSIYKAASAGFDLQLSGHTHGGQFVPFAWIISWVQPYGHGLHRHADGPWIYVSRGTGYWGPPNRLGAPSEISLLTLRRA